MITVYHLEQSRSTRILWLLEELGLDYRIEHFARDPVTRRAPESLRRIHPLGKSPVIRDGELVLAESGAIVEYLIRRYGEGRLAVAPDSPEWPRYVYWLHFAEGSAPLPLILDLLLDMTGQGESLLAGFVEQEIANLTAYLEAELEGREHLVGDSFTAADLMITFAVEFAEVRGRLDGRPNCRAFLERMRERPAHRRAAEAS